MMSLVSRTTAGFTGMRSSYFSKNVDIFAGVGGSRHAGGGAERGANTTATNEGQGGPEQRVS